MGKEVIVLCLIIFLAGFVFAEAEAVHEPGTGIVNPEVKEASNSQVEANQVVSTRNMGNDSALRERINARIENGDYIMEDGKKIRIQNSENNRVQLRDGNLSVECACNLSQEQIQNRTRLKVALSNGRNAEIKIMPNVASEVALERLRLRNCIAEENCTIELKEVNALRDINGTRERLAYELQTKRESRIFGLFKAKMQVRAQVDAENGDVIAVKKPWWAFLARESKEQ
jgi:archaellum component FlaG (FlaF/FlaG flagellin family)